jgi:hypothetical protein
MIHKKGGNGSGGGFVILNTHGIFVRIECAGFEVLIYQVMGLNLIFLLLEYNFEGRLSQLV